MGFTYVRVTYIAQCCSRLYIWQTLKVAQQSCFRSVFLKMMSWACERQPQHDCSGSVPLWLCAVECECESQGLFRLRQTKLLPTQLFPCQRSPLPNFYTSWTLVVSSVGEWARHTWWKCWWNDGMKFWHLKLERTPQLPKDNKEQNWPAHAMSMLQLLFTSRNGACIPVQY